MDAGPRLEHWTLVGSGGVDGLALAGQVYGDDRFAPGHAIVTSALVMLDLVGRRASTRNSAYRLGMPSPHFRTWLEEADRTFDQLVDLVNTARRRRHDSWV